MADPTDVIAPAQLHQRLLEEYAPPSLVVTAQLEIVNVSARADRFLQAGGAEPARDLLRVVRPSLRADLLAAVQQAIRTRGAVEVPTAAPAGEPGAAGVNVVVRPALESGEPPRGYLLILFREEPPNATGAPGSRELLRRVVSAQEEERARIARDLHDSFGQQLTALRLALERHARECGTGTPANALDDALTITRDLSREVDYLAWELRPAALDDLGLGVALPRFVENWAARAGVPAEVRISGFTAGLLGRRAEVAFYRVAQEALNNVTKHAHASRVDVVLTAADGTVALVIEDDGVGFDAATHVNTAGGIGLASMRERAALVGARLDVESAPGKGTSVFLRTPARQDPEDPQ